MLLPFCGPNALIVLLVHVHDRFLVCSKRKIITRKSNFLVCSVVTFVQMNNSLRVSVILYPTYQPLKETKIMSILTLVPHVHFRTLLVVKFTFLTRVCSINMITIGNIFILYCL